MKKKSILILLLFSIIILLSSCYKSSTKKRQLFSAGSYSGQSAGIEYRLNVDEISYDEFIEANGVNVVKDVAAKKMYNQDKFYKFDFFKLENDKKIQIDLIGLRDNNPDYNINLTYTDNNKCTFSAARGDIYDGKYIVNEYFYREYRGETHLRLFRNIEIKEGHYISNGVGSYSDTPYQLYIYEISYDDYINASKNVLKDGVSERMGKAPRYYRIELFTYYKNERIDIDLIGLEEMYPFDDAPNYNLFVDKNGITFQKVDLPKYSIYKMTYKIDTIRFFL